jgi:uncharacterized protein
MLVGVLSDTHGTLHPDLLPLFRKARVETILHAGDLGDMLILRELEAIAPVLAVRGNVDVAGEVGDMPEEIEATLGGVRVYMTHVGMQPRAWASRLSTPPPDVIVALCELVGPTLFLNPGSAGTRPRFGGGLSAALLRVKGRTAEAEIVVLQKGTR